MQRRHPYELSYLKLEQWSQMPFSTLKFELKQSCLAPLVTQVKTELKAKGITPFFHVWISDEWFCPDGCPGIAVPYYLFHPSLTRLHRSSGLETEGATRTHALKLIRHEVGHAIENAWRLRRLKVRQQLFGKSSTPYPHAYQPLYESRDFVKHLGAEYAQSHPDEDWAETFAVWLGQSPTTWRRRYAGTKALDKLEYCAQIMQKISGTRPLNQERFVVSPIEDQKGTIESFLNSRAKSRLRYLSRTISLPNFSHELPSTAMLKQTQQLYKQNGLGILM